MSQAELRQAQKLDFCYLCGKQFNHEDNRNRDHVPPKAIFAISDRNPPLVLPTHMSCNGERSEEDEIVAQLLGVLHGKYSKPERTRLEFELFARGTNADPMIGLRDIPFRRMVFRFVRAFHAALYSVYVEDKGGMIYAPFPAYKMINDELQPVEDDPGRYRLTLAIKEQRKAGRVDRVECFNRKCVYECVWPKFDDGRRFCLFALQIYNWEELGDPRLGPERGCIGWYYADVPASATFAMELNVSVSNVSPLNPFAS